LNAVFDIALELGVSATCEAFGVPRATFYRHHAPMLGPKTCRASPPRRLCDAERSAVLTVLHEPRFAGSDAYPELAIRRFSSTRSCSCWQHHRQA
jgi:hypothetical protein